MNSRLRLSLSAITIVGSCLLFAATPSLTLAGPPPPPEPAPTTGRAPDSFQQGFIAFYGTNYFNERFDNLNEGFSVSRYSYYGEFRFKLSPTWMIKLFTYADYSLYSFSNVPQPSPVFTNLLRGAAFERVDLTLAYTFAPGWALVGGGRITSGVASNGDFGNSFTGGGIFGVKKSFFDGGVDITLGATYTTRLSRSAQVLPYFDIDVNVLPSFVKVPVNLRLVWGGGILSYRVTDNLSIMGEGRVDARTYRLNQNNVVLPGAVWSESSLDVGLGFGWTPLKRNWSFTVMGGYSLFRNVQVFNYSGQKVFDQDVKPAPYLSALVHASF
jgi:hypothetical protein